MAGIANLPIRIRRGLSANRENYTPQVGELMVTTDTKELYIGDGVTPGGHCVTDTVKDLILEKVVNKDIMGVANGVATLDGNGKVLTTQLPALAISSTQVVETKAEMLALTNVQEGDVVIVTEESNTYIHNGGDTKTIADFTIILTPDDGVLKINGYSGPDVTLDTDDIAEGSVNLYFTDARVLAKIQNTSVGEMSDVNIANIVKGDILAVDGNGVFANRKVKDLVAEGNVSFEDLVDTPATGSMADKAGQVLAINASGTGIVYSDIIDGGTF